MVSLSKILLHLIKEKPVFVFNQSVFYISSLFGVLYVFFGPFGLPRPILALWGVCMLYGFFVIFTWDVGEDDKS